MIGGRLNGSTLACRICEPAPNVRRIRACAESAADLRSANGFNRATMKALFGSDAPSSSEKPIIERVCSTAGICFNNASTCLVTSLVRATDAPSGNCTEMKKAP